MHSPQVTVAMAVFNAEPFLEAAVRSILDQSYGDFELLLIDDGSNDNSREICRRFEGEDKRIRGIFKSKNDGLAVVRNISIIEANGDFLMMVDADDLMEKDTIEKAVELARKDGADAVIWDYTTFTGEKPPKDDSPSRLLAIDAKDRHKLLTLPAFMPVRMFRTGYLREKGIQFPAGLTKQDIPVHWRMITDEDCRVSLLPEKLFHYRQQPQATSRRRDRSVLSLAKVMDIVRENLIADGVYENYKKEFLNKRLSLLSGMYDYILPEHKAEALEMVKVRYDDEARAFIKSGDCCLDRPARWFYGRIDGKISDTLAHTTFLAIRWLYRKLK